MLPKDAKLISGYEKKRMSPEGTSKGATQAGIEGTSLKAERGTSVSVRTAEKGQGGKNSSPPKGEHSNTAPNPSLEFEKQFDEL